MAQNPCRVALLSAILLLLLVGTAFPQTFYSWRYRTHATDCTSLTDGKPRDLCFEVDDNTLWKCEPSVGDCDTAAEWKFAAVGGDVATVDCAGELGACTPDVSGVGLLIVACDSACTITDFDAGAGALYNGQPLSIVPNNNNATFDMSASGLEGVGSEDYAAASGDYMKCVYATVDSQWHCDFWPSTVNVSSILTSVTIADATDPTIKLDFDISANTPGATRTITVPDANVTMVSDPVSASGTVTKSIYWPAGAISSDGTNCADPAEVTINSGPKQYTIICTDNDGSRMHGAVVMPDGWNAGTVTFEVSYIQTAADTSALNMDVACQGRGAGETVNATYGTEIAVDDAAVTGSNAVDSTTSAAVTCNCTTACAAGDTLFWYLDVDATGTTTAMATLNVLGVKLEYVTVNSGD